MGGNMGRKPSPPPHTASQLLDSGAVSSGITRRDRRRLRSLLSELRPDVEILGAKREAASSVLESQHLEENGIGSNASALQGDVDASGVGEKDDNLEEEGEH